MSSNTEQPAGPRLNKLGTWLSRVRQRACGLRSLHSPIERDEQLLVMQSDAHRRLDAAWSDHMALREAGEKEQQWEKAGGVMGRQDAIDALGIAFERLVGEAAGRGRVKALEACDDMWHHSALAVYLADHAAPYCSVSDVVTNDQLEEDLEAVVQWLHAYIEKELQRHNTQERQQQTMPVYSSHVSVPEDHVYTASTHSHHSPQQLAAMQAVLERKIADGSYVSRLGGRNARSSEPLTLGDLHTPGEYGRPKPLNHGLHHRSNIW